MDNNLNDKKTNSATENADETKKDITENGNITQKNAVDILSKKLEINIEMWDIAKIKADALITPINSWWMWFWAIDWVIQRNAWWQFHNQAANKLPLNHWDTVVAKKKQDHMGMFGDVVFVIDDLEWPLSDIVSQWLQAADKAWYQSVSLPAMRMWVMMWAVEKTVEETINQIRIGVENFVKNWATNIKKITFVVYNDKNTSNLLTHTFKFAV